jgi:hypothetical protein
MKMDAWDAVLEMVDMDAHETVRENCNGCVHADTELCRSCALGAAIVDVDEIAYRLDYAYTLNH